LSRVQIPNLQIAITNSNFVLVEEVHGKNCKLNGFVPEIGSHHGTLSIILAGMPSETFEFAKFEAD